MQGTRFQANEVESALRGIGEVNEPTLEWQMVRPTGDDRPLVVRVERGTGAGGDDDEIAKRCAGALRDALGIDADVTVLGARLSPDRATRRGGWSTNDGTDRPRRPRCGGRGRCRP